MARIQKLHSACGVCPTKSIISTHFSTEWFSWSITVAEFMTVLRLLGNEERFLSSLNQSFANPSSSRFCWKNTKMIILVDLSSGKTLVNKFSFFALTFTSRLKDGQISCINKYTGGQKRAKHDFQLPFKSILLIIIIKSWTWTTTAGLKG